MKGVLAARLATVKVEPSSSQHGKLGIRTTFGKRSSRRAFAAADEASEDAVDMAVDESSLFAFTGFGEKASPSEMYSAVLALADLMNGFQMEIRGGNPAGDSVGIRYMSSERTALEKAVFDKRDAFVFMGSPRQRRPHEGRLGGTPCHCQS